MKMKVIKVIYQADNFVPSAYTHLQVDIEIQNVSKVGDRDHQWKALETYQRGLGSTGIQKKKKRKLIPSSSKFVVQEILNIN